MQKENRSRRIGFLFIFTGDRHIRKSKTSFSVVLRQTADDRLKRLRKLALIFISYP